VPVKDERCNLCCAFKASTFQRRPTCINLRGKHKRDPACRHPYVFGLTDNIGYNIPSVSVSMQVKEQLSPTQHAEVDSLILRASNLLTRSSQLEEQAHRYPGQPCVDDSGGESGKELLVRVKAAVRQVLQEAIQSENALGEECYSLVQFCEVLEEVGPINKFHRSDAIRWSIPPLDLQSVSVNPKKS
jgi:hypothetical protein